MSRRTWAIFGSSTLTSVVLCFVGYGGLILLSFSLRLHLDLRLLHHQCSSRYQQAVLVDQVVAAALNLLNQGAAQILQILL